MTLDEILDCPFLGIALDSFLTEARAAQDWPEQEKTRLRAYARYEEELVKKSAD